MFSIRKVTGKISVFLIIIMFVTAFPLQVFAADTSQSITQYNADVLAKKQALEKKYGIRITYPQNENSYAGIGTATLATLDTCLEYVSPELIKQLSEYYSQKNGVRLTVTYTHTANFETVENARPVAAFTDALSLIEVLVPRATSNSMSSGNGPTAIVHELGHAYHEFLISNMGAAALRRQWTALNGGAAYGGRADRTVFVSDYAASSYDEDFADTFAHAFVCNRAGYSIAKYLKTASGGATALGSKVAYLEKLVAQYSPGAKTAQTNLRKCYTTPDSITYRGLKFSGSSMEYVGFNAPYGVINAIVRQLPFETKSKVWDKSIGGWLVVSKSGKEYIVFPGGNYTEIKQ
ncbi:MAG: putative zinc-binding metallopeptidase [Oscillospiraceae bacterium]|nr:putative zinc-binding metallopeptidase [Oscillospiraceae bacterium]